MKNLKSLFTALLLLCGLTASAHDFEVEGIYYDILSSTDKTVEVTSGNNRYTDCVVIPESVTYNGTTYSVTSIGESAFQYCSGLTSVVIGNSVTSIGYEAFYDCSGLTSIEIPNSVTSIGDEAFYECESLKEVHISDLATWCNIDFENASANPLCYAKNLYLDGELVTELAIPDGVTEIKGYAFYGCTGLTSIEIPNSVTSIGTSAFYGCTGLTSIEIPNSVTSIGSHAFSHCYSLTSITIPNSVTSIGSSAFYNCI